MRIYIVYLVTSLFTFYEILLWPGFPNYTPILALLGAIILFVFGMPVFVYRYKSGLVIGLIANLLILPYKLYYILSDIDQFLSDVSVSFYTYLFILILCIASYGVFLYAIYLSLIGLLRKKKRFIVKFNKYIKLFLAAFPVTLYILYIVWRNY